MKGDNVEIKEGMIGYNFTTLLGYYNSLINERQDIIDNLAMDMDRSGIVIQSLVEDLKNVTKKMERLEKQVLWTEKINW